MKIKLCSLNDSLKSLNEYDFSPRHWVASLLPISNKTFWWSSGYGMKKMHTCTAYFAKSKTRSNGETSHTIKSRCACVWNISGWNSHPFLHDSIYYFGIWAIFLLRFFFFFLYASGHDFFCIAHIFWHDEYGESCQRDGVFLCGWEA